MGITDFQTFAAHGSKKNGCLLILVHPLHGFDPSLAKFWVPHPHPYFEWKEPLRGSEQPHLLLRRDSPGTDHPSYSQSDENHLSMGVSCENKLSIFPFFSSNCINSIGSSSRKREGRLARPTPKVDRFSARERKSFSFARVIPT